MRACSFLVLMLWAAAAAAQAAPPAPLMYKCLDAQRRVTYSNITCEKQGLQDGGPVADRTTSMPFTAPSVQKPTADGPPPTVKLKPPADEKPIK